MGKARRREREGGEGAGLGGGAGAGAGVGLGGGSGKLYLEQALLEVAWGGGGAGGAGGAGGGGVGELRALVELPGGVEYREWVASHTLALFEHVNLVYGAVCEWCTAERCGDMAGPGPRPYAWVDERGKKVRLPAPRYIDYVMTFAQKTLADEALFPTKYGREFPPTAAVEGSVRRVLRLLYHVVAHLYAAHFRHLVLLRLHAHLHLTFAHLTLLHRRYHLLDPKEAEVLEDLERALLLHDGEAEGDAELRPAPPAPPPP